MGDEPRLAGLVVLAAPAAKAQPWAVSLEPAPATTGTRWATVSTVNFMADSCSASVMVEHSPVVPQMIMASVPRAI